MPTTEVETEQIDVSVITVTFNSIRVSRECLRRLHDVTKGVRFEVFVVDNASSDGGSEQIRREFPSVEIIQNSDNEGFAKANNQAIARARGRYILLLNPDVFLLEDSISRVFAFAEEHPRAAVVGCRTTGPDGRLHTTGFQPPGITNLCISLFGLQRIFPRNRFFGRERITWWDQRDARQVPVIGGWFMFVRKAAVDEVGPLDERFFMYAEEVDWCVRFRQAGWHVWFTPNTTVQHLGGGSTVASAFEQRRAVARSVVLFMKKHHSRPYVWCYRVLLALYFALRFPLRNRLSSKPG